MYYAKLSDFKRAKPTMHPDLQKTDWFKMGLEVIGILAFVWVLTVLILV